MTAQKMTAQEIIAFIGNAEKKTNVKKEDIINPKNACLNVITKENTLQNIVNIVYPVGAIYISTVATSPATLFGFGTWEQIQDRFLLAAGSTYSAGATGGEATHTLTVDEMPKHSHGIQLTSKATASGTDYVRVSSTGDVTSNLISETGGGQAHNNMPPYLSVYVWQRVG